MIPAAGNTRCSQLLAILILVARMPQSPCAAAEVDFSRDILPILSDQCFHCHEGACLETVSR